MGDVRPYLQVAARLQRDGVPTCLVANAGYEALAEQARLPDYRPVWVDAPTMMRFQQAANAGRGTFTAEYLESWFGGYGRIRDALSDCSLVLSRNPLVAPIARLAGAEFWRISNQLLPDDIAAALPYPTRLVPLDLLHACTRRAPARRIAAAATRLGLLAEHSALLWAERRNLGNLMGYRQRHLQALRALGCPDPGRLDARPPARTLIGQSADLLPCPPGASFTGPWREHIQDWQPDPALSAFMAGGAPPVFLGFGSNPSTRQGRPLAAVWGPLVAALRRSGARVLVSVGWGHGTAPLPAFDDPGVFCTGDVPHAWLLPRTAAAVSHLGVGTTLAIAQAGVPCLPVPFTQDQFFWAWRLRDLGTATQALDPDRLDPGRVARCVDRILGDARLAAAASALGERLRREDGLAVLSDHVSRALEAVE